MITILFTKAAKGKRRRKKPNRRARRGEDEGPEPTAPISAISLALPTDDGFFPGGGSKGLGHAMMQVSGEAMDAELANQDLKAVEDMDTEFKEETLNVRS